MIVFRRLLRTSESNTELNRDIILFESGLQWTTKGISLRETTQDFKERNTELYRVIHYSI